MHRCIRILVFLLVLTGPAPALCVDLGDLNPKDPAKGTIDDAENAAQRLLVQAQQTGNGMLSNAASQLDAVAQSTLLILGNDLSKNIGQLNTAEQQALVSLEKLQKSINVDVSKVYDLKDTTVIDLTQWESQLPLTHTPDFFVQTIKNTAFLPEPGDYHVTVMAYGFGINSDSKADITATLEGAPLTFDEVDQSKNGVAILGIPNGALTPYFQASSLKVVTLNLGVTISRHRTLFGWHSNHYNFPIRLTLYPSQVASVTLHASTPVYKWVDVGDVLSNVYSTPEKNGCKGGPDCRANNGTLDVRLVGALSGEPKPGAQRIASAVLQCNSGSICDFSGCQNISVVENGTHATATWCTWSHPTQWQLRGHVQEWRQVGTQVNDTQAVVDVDHPATLALPAAYSLLILDVKAFTHTPTR